MGDDDAEAERERAAQQIEKHLHTVAPGHNRAARRAQEAELRKIEKLTMKRVKRSRS